mmetsp:Transcript_54860/g.81467  ORF Transcript_54860/g.81467 Transcript_54860/m.81467 type:complete len:337 (+) Transcript_54860:109-1119(+)|eukprot:CAMPEP_0195516872 /NCGR_PEP_ID=MMETSP0794_2-20130614/8878_1 /TAXON_ID=515487 /ORGANISM="Stephanopyxis turris, Strain CCMP 815" /LENGTH=336 /DNA_ID=CAMNT_0040645577 /DNA_START=109 /DNA_END=1119 /DNA_ORIENTATION=-
MSAATSGNGRFDADMRQHGGLQLAYSLLITIGSLSGIARISAGGGNTPTEGLPLFNLIASCFLCLVGTLGTIVGWLVVVNDRGHKTLSMANNVVIQFTWLPFLGGLVGTAMNAAAGNADAFNLGAYNATSGDVSFVGAMGFLGILSNASAFAGSVGFTSFSIHAYQDGKATTRSGKYFRGRMTYYCCLQLIAGFSQLALGSHILGNFGKGPLSPPVQTGTYLVFFPEISVTVGTIQLLVGFVGIARRCGMLGGNDSQGSLMYTGMCFFMWICMLSMQILVQTSYPAGDTAVAAAPTQAAMFFALATFPAYLDWKMRSVPDEIPADYFTSEPEVSKA